MSFDVPVLGQFKHEIKQKWQLTTRLDEAEAARALDDKELDKWRNKVFRLDKLICRCCGTKVRRVIDLVSDRAEAHHIKGREHKPTRYDVRNGLCVCKRCHDRITGAVNDKLKIIASKWFTLHGTRYINGRKPVRFKAVA